MKGFLHAIFNMKAGGLFAAALAGALFALFMRKLAIATVLAVIALGLWLRFSRNRVK